MNIYRFDSDIDYVSISMLYTPKLHTILSMLVHVGAFFALLIFLMYLCTKIKFKTKL